MNTSAPTNPTTAFRRTTCRQAAGLLTLAALSLVGLTGCGSSDSAAPPPAATASVATITTVAGTGAPGYNGDNQPATAAGLRFPAGVAVDTAGTLWIADTLTTRIRKVDAAGVITTVAGGTGNGYNGDGGLATLAQVNVPAGVAVDRAGNFWIADSQNHRIRKVDAITGLITTVAGTGVGGFSGDGGLATLAQVNGPAGVAVDTAGNLWIADLSNSRIRKVDVAGVITTVAGTGTAGFNGDGGQATLAQVNGPAGVAVDTAGNFWIADSRNHRIRKVDAITGLITTVAGTGTAGYNGDNQPATAAQVNGPAGVAVDTAGNFWIADSQNHRIRKVGL